MRLDHLLSKEHWPPDSFWWSRAAPGSRWPVSLDGLHASGVVLEGGTLTSSAGIVCCALVRPLGAWNACGDADRFVGTLLGPERADPAGGFPWSWTLLLCQGLPVSHTAVLPVGGDGSGGVVGWVSGRTLRTAQWTRASSDSD